MRKDYMVRLLALLLFAFAGCFGLSFLPDTLFGLKLKKVDLLSDLCLMSEDEAIASLRAQLETTHPSETTNDSIQMLSLTDSIVRVISLRDSLSLIMNRNAMANQTGDRIEDYSEDQMGLRQFFTALNNSRTRPVRIAFLGDSFIEGDILVSDFRNTLQEKFGGSGIGFAPVNTVAAQYRTTATITSSGWKTYSIIDDKKLPFVLSGLLFEATADGTKIIFKAGSNYPSLKPAHSLKFIYDRNDAAVMHLIANATDSVSVELPPADKVCQYIYTGDSLRSAVFGFTNAKGLRAIGIAQEDETGIVVDNFSLRGNSGLPLARLDSSLCESLSAIRSYDLIIMQYGLNIASEGMLDYTWYKSRMSDVIRHLRHCFPNSDVLMLSVSDRANQYNGTFSTMPAVLALLHTQRQIAQQVHIPFWNMFGGMGGENSMVQFVKNGWAGKDYTHLSFKGGAEISQRLIDVLMLEKEFYDRIEANK